MVALIVDDSVSCSELLVEVLKEFFSILAVKHNADSGMDYYENNSIDLVFLDLRLPDRPGLDVLQEMLHLKAHVPVVIYSADARQETIKLALSLGAFSYLSKPINISELLSVIRKLNFATY